MIGARNLVRARLSLSTTLILPPHLCNKRHWTECRALLSLGCLLCSGTALIDDDYRKKHDFTPPFYNTLLSTTRWEKGSSLQTQLTLLTSIPPYPCAACRAYRRVRYSKISPSSSSGTSQTADSCWFNGGGGMGDGTSPTREGADNNTSAAPTPTSPSSD